MYYLYRNKIICYLLSVCCISTVAAQQTLNLENHDEKPYYFGISLSAVQTHVRITKEEQFLKQGIVQVINPKLSIGIGFGLHATARLNNHFELRFNPQLVISSSYMVDYSVKNILPNVTTNGTLKIPTLPVSLPLQLKFTSDRIGNFKVYMMGGVSYNIDLAKEAVDANSDFIRTKKQFYGLELGAGCSFYLPFVIVSPEIKLRYMINNGLSSVKFPFDGVIRTANPYFTFFTIHFEG